MKIISRGFTLVELLVIIAIVGILIASLYPSLLSYLMRGRDTQRTTSLKELLTATINYQTDNDILPAGTSVLTGAGVPNCVNQVALSMYLVKFPIDPNKNSILSCGQPGLYGYGTGMLDGTDTIVLSAVFENQYGGNTFGGVTTFQGNGLSGTVIRGIDSLVKGSGSGYVIRY